MLNFPELSYFTYLVYNYGLQHYSDGWRAGAFQLGQEAISDPDFPRDTNSVQDIKDYVRGHPWYAHIPDVENVVDCVGAEHRKWRKKARLYYELSIKSFKCRHRIQP